MGYERTPRGGNGQGDYYGRRDGQDYGRDDRAGRQDGYAGGRDYRGERGYGYGAGDQGYGRYGQQGDRYQSRGEGRGGYGASRYQDRGSYAPAPEYHGSYASDGRRFEDVGRYRTIDNDDYRDPDAAYRGGNRASAGRPQGYDDQDRGFFQRAGDEVRSWFGDDDAERRREEDARRDEQDQGRDNRYRDAGRHHDADYHNWRSGQIAALDRDYDEYRQENRSKFESEFATWRTGRQGQRDSLGKVGEHMEVVGSDGSHVGTVDKVRGDRIILTKNDADAGGRHHSIPSRWIGTVDGKVTLTKTAAEAKQQWQDEERNQAMFGDDAKAADRATGTTTQASSSAAATGASTAKTY